MHSVMDLESQSAKDEALKGDGKDEEFDESVLDGYITKDNVIAPEIVDALRSSDQSARVEAATKLRRLVDKRETTSIQPIINSGILPDIVSLISLDDVGLQVHLNAVLATVTTGSPEQVSVAIETGVLPKFILLASSSAFDEARDDAIIALGNIGGTSRLLRDTVIREGGLKLLLDIWSNPSQHEDSHVYSAAIAIEEFTRPLGLNAGDYIAQHILPILIKYINNNANKTSGILETSLRVLGNIIADTSLLDTLFDTNIIPRLVELCTSQPASARDYALICVTGVIKSSRRGTDQLIHAGILEAFRSCILSGEAGHRSYACFAALNIAAAGTLKQAKALIEAGLVSIFVQVVSDSEENNRTRRDAVWTLSALAQIWGQHHHKILETLMEANTLEACFLGLTLKGGDVVGVSLKGIRAFLKTEWKGQHNAIERSKAGGGVQPFMPPS